MARSHVARLDASDPDLVAVFYVDGHVRADQGARKVAKTHLSRLKFPAPATVETWISDASGDPVLVVMAEPGASPAMELRRLLPDLRRAVGDQLRVLVGFDRGGWSPALFASLDNCHSCDPVDPGHWVATLPVRCGASGDILPRSASGSLLSVTPNLVGGRGCSRPGHVSKPRGQVQTA
jgi:hypothetical protein